MAAKGRQDRFWELRKAPGPYSEPDEARQIYKCTGCGAETEPRKGWNGEPDRHRCLPGCPCSGSDWRIGGAGRAYRANFDRIFPDAPGSGI